MEKTDPFPPQEIINETAQVDDTLDGKIIENSISLKRALSMELKREELMVETYTGKIVTDEKKHMNKIQDLYSALFSATMVRKSIH